MPRPRKCRLVRNRPAATWYKPQGIPAAELKGVVLTLEGLEALRLADALGMDQQGAAELMDVSTATFCRILAEARQTVARALSQGWAIRIEGGDYSFAAPEEGPGAAGVDEATGFGRGRGRGRGRRGCHRGGRLPEKEE